MIAQLLSVGGSKNGNRVRVPVDVLVTMVFLISQQVDRSKVRQNDIVSIKCEYRVLWGDGPFPFFCYLNTTLEVRIHPNIN